MSADDTRIEMFDRSVRETKECGGGRGRQRQVLTGDGREEAELRSGLERQHMC